jgi:hypothetical protein
MIYSTAAEEYAFPSLSRLSFFYPSVPVVFSVFLPYLHFLPSSLAGIAQSV